MSVGIISGGFGGGYGVVMVVGAGVVYFSVNENRAFSMLKMKVALGSKFRHTVDQINMTEPHTNQH